MKRVLRHYLGMLVVYPLRTWQTRQSVLKNKADEKSDRKETTGNLGHKGNSDPFWKEGSIKMQLLVFERYLIPSKGGPLLNIVLETIENVRRQIDSRLRRVHELA